ncbi:UPF0764 protein C16orf89 homolog isoform X2 [Belonocnema kinseyi]|uniref:UPF0764 protein C16orf89 homolog isoform X2 n=1 Tax=Belonocnema kinseyi TaxID=2817044 RepID=UPI00143D2D0C|nr:UPF0764 protein C16orf89 homolog isoform X2 [Belonocnema kinseyi]
MRFSYPELIFFVIICTCCSGIYAIFNTEEFDRRLNALWKVVNYMAHRAEKMNVDAIFGLTLAEAHIMATLSHSNAHFIQLDHRLFLANVGKICDDARRFMKKNVKPENKVVAIMNEALNRLEPWIYPIEWKNGLLAKPILRKLNNTHEISSKLLNSGTPSEVQSDYCISNMLKGYPTETCKVSEECELMLLRNDNPQGYALTHRLLLVWIAKAFHCQELKLTTYIELASEYCTLILQNLIDIESLEFPPPGTDLACEEVVICGSEGYLEFSNDYYANLIMSWQQPVGCFDSQTTLRSDIKELEIASCMDAKCLWNTPQAKSL